MGCSSVPGISPETDFAGVWEISGISGISLPPMSEVCRAGTLELRRDGVAIGISGEQITTASYAVEKRGSNTFLVQRNVQVNDKPNCQGYAPGFVRENYLTEGRVEKIANELRIYFSPGDPTMYVSYRKKGG